MRVTCDGCGAKYAIADERLQGRSVRVKCKKCGTSIAVGALNASGAAPAEPTWTVLLDDGDQKPVTPGQLAELYRDGTVHDDSYLWKEGMDDWLPLGELDEAKRVVAGLPEPGVEVTAVPVVDPAPVERARRAGGPGANLFGDGATPKAPGVASPAPGVATLRSETTPLSPRASGLPRPSGEVTPRTAAVAQRPGGEAAPFSSRSGASPISQRGGAVPSSQRPAASPISQRSGADSLFGPSSSSPSSRRQGADVVPSSRSGVPSSGRSSYDDRVNSTLSGSRNDDSVLFSVASLSASAKKNSSEAPIDLASLAAPAPAPAAAPVTPAPGVITSESEASGMIDMRILSTMHGKSPKKEGAREDRVDDLINMGLTGSLFGGSSAPLTSPLLAPPSFEAPPPPPPPEFAPEVPPQVAEVAPSSGGTARDAEAPPMAAAAMQQGATRSKMPRWAPWAAGAVGLGLLGVIGLSALGGPSDTTKKEATPTAAKANDGAKQAPDPARETAARAPAAAEAPAVPEATPPPAETAAPTEVPPKVDEGAGQVAAARPEVAAAPAAPARPGDTRKRDEESGKKRREREEAEKKEAEQQRRAEQEKKAAEGRAAAAAAAAVAAPAGTAPFDRGAASAALSSASGGVGGCKKADGPTGLGRVAVTFAPSGVVSSAVVEGPPYAGTPVGACVANKFRGAKVPAFSGSAITVKKSFSL